MMMMIWCLCLMAGWLARSANKWQLTCLALSLESDFA